MTARTCAVMALALGTAGVASSQPPAPAVLEALGQQALASGKAPGFSLAVEWRGKPYFVGGFGLADTRERTAATAETRYAIGSISKQFRCRVRAAAGGAGKADARGQAGEVPADAAQRGPDYAAHAVEPDQRPAQLSQHARA